MIGIVLILLCLLVNGLLASYEAAFLSVPKQVLRAQANKGGKNAQKLLAYRENPERVLSVVQIGITLVGAVAGAIGGVGASEVLEPFIGKLLGTGEALSEAIAVGFVVIVITYISVVFGELVPKTLAIRNPSKIVLSGAPWLFFAEKVLGPLVVIFEYSTKKILNLMFRKSTADQDISTDAIEIETLSPTHRKFMLNLAEIEKRQARDILIPWNKVVHINLEDPLAVITQQVLSSGHTRLPVVKNDKAIGLLHSKEFMVLRESGEQHWQAIVRKVLLIRENDSALKILQLMQMQASNLAVVVNIHDLPTGIVTLADIMEEIVGEMYDEDDDGAITKMMTAKANMRRILGR